MFYWIWSWGLPWRNLYLPWRQAQSFPFHWTVQCLSGCLAPSPNAYPQHFAQIQDDSWQSWKLYRKVWAKSLHHLSIHNLAYLSWCNFCRHRARICNRTLWRRLRGKSLLFQQSLSWCTLCLDSYVSGQLPHLSHFHTLTRQTQWYCSVHGRGTSPQSRDSGALAHGSTSRSARRGSHYPRSSFALRLTDLAGLRGCRCGLIGGRESGEGSSVSLKSWATR